MARVRPLIAPVCVFLALLLLAAPVPAEDYEQETTIADAVVRGEPKSGPKPAEAAKGVDLGKGPKAQWIWGPDKSGERYNLGVKFAAEDVRAATIVASCDNVMKLKLNGKVVFQSSNWSQAEKADVTKLIRDGDNELLVEASNEGSVAGLAVKLGLEGRDGKVRYVVSDKQWKASLPGKELTEVSLHGAMGVGPWNNVFANAGKQLPTGQPRNVFQVLPGFQVELLYTVPKETLGSWVSIAFDDKGRLLASDQGGKGLCRITAPPIGATGAKTKVEHLSDFKVSSAQGMLHAFGSLYLSVNGGPGSGLYRAKDTNGDDQYDDLQKLFSLQGGGEHGPHAVRLSPDGNGLYVIAGNHTNPPELTSSRMPTNWSEDLLLPRQWDARGHARGKLAPGGWICRTDAEGKTWEMISMGYRNPYDMDFNADGELFAYDADMEWDMGSPWYRPTRVVHAVSGSEFGWRSGTGKWPTYFIDSLPAAVDIGPGSPVGVTFGYGTKFPAKYQKALYILDWTFGTMYAIHLTPDGASYRGEKEEFLSRSPLPLTDAAVGPDGALYFTVGGRGTQSELYRVTYVGDQATKPADATDKKFAAERARRRAMEELHERPDDGAIDKIWTALGDDDRHVRYAARVALEHLKPELWQQRAVAESDPRTLLSALTALARQSKPEAKLQGGALAALGKLDIAQLPLEQRLDAMRAYALLFIRLGKPGPAAAAAAIKQLDPLYPSESDDENRELVRVLVYLNSPTVIEKTLKLMKAPRGQSPEEISELLARNQNYGGTIAKILANLPELQNMHAALALRNMRYGWTLEQRKDYFAWLDKAAQRSGGASYQGFVANIRSEALANASEAERKALTATAPPPKPTELPKPIGPGKTWEVEDLVEMVGSGLVDRSFAGGKRAFAASRCVVCHRYDGDGGATGPDLTNTAGRFSVRDLSEALIEPSKVVSDQYRAHQIRTDGGKVLTGRLLGEQDGKVQILIDPEDASKVVELDKDEILRMQPSKVSLMPKDLLNQLNADEVADLLAYLLSRGNPEDLMFKP